MNRAAAMHIPDHTQASRSPGGSSPAVLSVQDLAVVYQASQGPRTAVENLSLQVAPGEFVSILGPSGCGKSTMLNVVGGLLPPTRGQVLVSGERIRGPRADVGVVFQKPTLLPWQTVEQNVMIPIMALGRNLADYKGRCQQLLKLVGLQDYARNYPNELSGGMQQRVGIARALIHDPSLLMMDEPFAALDAMTRERMSLELQDIWSSSGKTVLFITHSIPEAVFLSDRILVMSSSPGRIIREITVDISRPRSMEAMATPEFALLCGEIRKMFVEH